MREDGVSSLELFFDLVFVFTITQLTSVLAHEPSWKGLFQVTLMLGVIFWMYGGYAWLTNSVALDRIGRRLTLLGGMAGFLVVALTIPGAFDGSGLSFGLAYLLVVLIHMGMFARSSHMGVRQAIVRLVPFNITTAGLVVIGGALGGGAQYALWALAFVAEWGTGLLVSDSGFVIEPTHFVERHGLVVLIAIGESVVAVGIGASGLPVDVGLEAAVVLGLALSAGLWWSYFGSGEEEAAKRCITAMEVSARPRKVLFAYGYWHLPILLGIITIAVALKKATGHAWDPLPQAEAIALGGGGALFLGGEALFRRTLGMESVPDRAVTALLALMTIPIGTTVSAAAQLLALLALLVGMLVFEDRSGAEVSSELRPEPHESW